MSDHCSELDRRTRQFARYLKRMHDRAFDEVRNCCYIIFEHAAPEGLAATGRCGTR